MAGLNTQSFLGRALGQAALGGASVLVLAACTHSAPMAPPREPEPPQPVLAPPPPPPPVAPEYECPGDLRCGDVPGGTTSYSCPGDPRCPDGLAATRARRD